MKKLDYSMVVTKCRNLADRIEKDGIPTIIVVIRTGGDEVARLLAGMLKCEIVEIHIARPDRTAIYHRLAKVSRLWAMLVYEFLFLIDRPYMRQSPQLPLHADVLLVDDAIQSGKTICLARAWAKKFSPERVRVATITDMRWRRGGDYSECRSLVSFPWSKNNTERRDELVGIYAPRKDRGTNWRPIL